MTHAVSGISVVIPNYNGRILLEQILPPLFEALINTSLPYEVIISDDYSTDDSLSFLSFNRPEVKVIANSVNRGFAPTINAGIAAATHSHVLLLNSDVKLTPNFFSELFKYFDTEDCFGVMGRIIGWDNDRIQDGGKYPAFHGLKIKTSGNYIPANDNNDRWLYSMYLSGANAFVDRKKLLLLGAFNELFAPFYVEDYELSVRAWRFGWKCYYEHKSGCRHKESVTIKSEAKKHHVNKIYYRNKMYLHALHLPAGLLFLWHIQLFFECVLNFVLLRSYYPAAVAAYLKNFVKVYRQRHEFTKLGRHLGKRLLSLQEVVEIVRINISKSETKPLKR